MNKWPNAYAIAEKGGTYPSRVRHVITMDWETFATKVVWMADPFVKLLTESLYAGDAWILKGAFSNSFMRQMQADTVKFFNSEPSSFHKMRDGTPDFHRIIDLKTGEKYAFKGCKHSAYFYRWNSDPLKLWETITERWRIVKFAMGLDCLEYESNFPRHGIVDRIQVVRYPPAIGYLEPHSDPYLHQRLFFSAYMGKRGVDYEGGGFYMVNAENRVVEMEDHVDVGDACIAYATVYHGVAPCDREKVCDWNASDGRWFLSMYSNASDHSMSRHTGKPAKLKLAGVLP